MLVESILNRLQKHAGFRYTNASFEEEGKKVRILVQIEPHRRSRPSCRKCCREGPVYDRARRARRFDFVPLWGLPVVVEKRTPVLFVEAKWADAEIDRVLRYLKERFPAAGAWQVSMTGNKDYTSPDGIRVAPAMALLTGLV